MTFNIHPQVSLGLIRKKNLFAVSAVCVFQLLLSSVAQTPRKPVGKQLKRSLEDEMCPTCIYLLGTLLFSRFVECGLTQNPDSGFRISIRKPEASEATPVGKSQTHTNSTGCNWQKQFWELTKFLQWHNTKCTSKGALWTLLLFWGLPGHWNHPCKSSFFAANSIQNLYSLFPKAASSNIISVNLVLVNPCNKPVHDVNSSLISFWHEIYSKIYSTSPKSCKARWQLLMVEL